MASVLTLSTQTISIQHITMILTQMTCHKLGNEISGWVCKGGWWLQCQMRREAIKKQKALDSLKRYEMVLQEEESVSNEFKLENFYERQQLNLQELKRRIKKYKNPKNQTEPVDIEWADKTVRESRDIAVQWSKRKPEKEAEQLVRQESDRVGALQKKPTKPSRPSHPKAFFNTTQKLTGGTSQEKRRRLYTAATNQWLVQANITEPSSSSPDNSTRYGRFRSHNPSAMGRIIKQIKSPSQLSSIESAHNLKPRLTHKTNLSSKCSSKLFIRTVDSYTVSKIRLQTEEAVRAFEEHIADLWSHYELLSSILVDMKVFIDDQRERLAKYRDHVCSNRFEFINEVVGQIKLSDPIEGAKKTAFINRLSKNILQSRIEEKVAMVLTCLYIINRFEPDSNLTNLVGYASANLVFVIDILRLTHQLPFSLSFSDQTDKIFESIEKFEDASYGQKMNKIHDVLSRMEHNSDVMSMLRQKIMVNMDKEITQSISKFVKPEKESIPFFEYARYIFQFLAFRVNFDVKQSTFKEVAIAPKPYVTRQLQHKKTIVIEPWGVLIAEKRQGGLYVRSNTSMFLKELAKGWNLIYWTDRMPNELDEILERLPKGQTLYQYHCKQEDQTMIKLLDRLGTDLSNTIILDRHVENFRYNRSMGIDLPWNGEKRDSKLLTLLQLLMPLTNSKHPLSKGMTSIQSLIQAIKPAKKMYRSRVKIRHKTQSSAKK